MQGFDAKKYAGKNISEETVLKLKECFDIFDYDRSGNISAEELVNTIRALGIEHQAQQILGIVQSSSHAEDMDFGAFLEVFGFSGDGNSESSLGQLFEYFDVNKQGAFGPEEFERVAASVG
jgi:Ca2+-binding EF-hand superfamily protein